MSLASLDDVKRILRSVPPSGYPRIKIGLAAADDISTADATKFLDAQEAYIISRIGFNPAVTDKLMIEVHANFTAFQIFVRLMNLSGGAGEIPEFVKEWNIWAESILDGIIKGDIKIDRPGADALPLTTRSSSFRQRLWEYIKLHTSTDWTPLEQERLIPYSENVRSEKEGGTLYTRDTDYEISYKTGEIRRLSDGKIAEDAWVYISYWYIWKGDFYEKVDLVSRQARAYYGRGR